MKRRDMFQKVALFLLISTVMFQAVYMEPEQMELQPMMDDYELDVIGQDLNKYLLNNYENPTIGQNGLKRPDSGSSPRLRFGKREFNQYEVDNEYREVNQLKRSVSKVKPTLRFGKRNLNQNMVVGEFPEVSLLPKRTDSKARPNFRFGKRAFSSDSIDSDCICAGGMFPIDLLDKRTEAKPMLRFG